MIEKMYYDYFIYGLLKLNRLVQKQLHMPNNKVLNLELQISKVIIQLLQNKKMNQ